MLGDRKGAALVSEAVDFRAKFESCARRFHDHLQGEGSVLHRHWKFEHCPAESCRLAREALSISPPLAPPLAPQQGEFVIVDPPDGGTDA